MSLALSTLANAETKLVVGWDRQLFPAYLIATASIKPTDSNEEGSNRLGDPNGQIGFVVEATEDDQVVTVSVSCDEFMETSQFTCKLPEAGKSYIVNPKIRYRFDRLSKCKQATPATLTARIQLGSAEIEETSTAVVFRSVNDCPLKVIVGEEVVDTKFTFAAFVNEQHPFVDKLLREALDLGVVNRFDGYHSGDNDLVFRQVYALWDLMVERDVRYSNITATAADSDEVASQHVRMIEETANNSQANCVDGSVLFVSLLRKIGIDAALVLEPGHCYVVFAADEKGERLYGLETTLVDTTIDDLETPEFMESIVEEESRGEQSWSSFVASVCLATEKLGKNLENYQNQTNVDYEIINIALARKRGVLPIPFDAKEQFVSFDHSPSDRTVNSADEDWADEESDGEATEEEWSDEAADDDESIEDDN